MAKKDIKDDLFAESENEQQNYEIVLRPFVGETEQNPVSISDYLRNNPSALKINQLLGMDAKDYNNISDSIDVESLINSKLRREDLVTIHEKDKIDAIEQKIKEFKENENQIENQ